MEESIDARFQMILYAGNSESASYIALECSREKNFVEANKQVIEAGEELRKAHQIQTELLQSQAAGKKIQTDILMIHAQDHFAMATVLKAMALEMIQLYEEVNELKEKIK